ncbi:MAG: C_GCAxxG_C_C family protein [Clostridia bacterium]|nr:C_GCAxxG_C_C family protein [Clostridia bacterium]
MSRGEIAKEYFSKGYNCAQAVLLAFEDVVGLDRASLLKITLPFGGGMGRLRLTCGAVSGMVMALGLITGTSEINGQAKSAQYAAVQELVKRFTVQNGSIICGELLTGTGVHTDTAPNAEPRTQGYYKKRPCADLCYDAAQILEEYLKKKEMLK